MKKFINLTTIVVMLCMLATMACGCSGKSKEEETTAESTVAEAIATDAETSAEATEATTAAASEETTAATTAETTVATVEETTAATTEATTAAETEAANLITDEMAYDAIRNHCLLENSEFASLSPENWVIISSTDTQVVVLFTSYTGSENRYYIDRATGNTTVTELVPGIIDEEQPTGESFNVRDHLAVEIYE